MNPEYSVRKLDKLLLTKREKCLLDLSFGGEMTDEAFHTLIEGLDFDAENQNYLLMLSSLGFSKGWEHFPPEIVPRLKGVHRYHQAHVCMGIPWLAQQIRALAAAEVPVMLLKGVAVLAYYSPARPRLIYTYAVAVPFAYADRALELLIKNGNVMGQSSPHSVLVAGDRDAIDMHRWIFEIHDDQFSDIWERAESIRLNGVDALVPSQEDMFLHLMDTQSSDYFRTESPLSRLQWLFDSVDIWSSSDKMSLERLAARAKQLHITSRVRLLLRLFTLCFPHFFEPEEFGRAFPETEGCDQLPADG